MDPAQQNKYETEPWKQAKLKVMEYVDIIKTQLSTQLSKEQGDELILNLMDINENLGNVMLLPELLSLFFTNTSDIMLDYLYAEPKGFIAQEACYQIRNALLSILRGSINEPKLNISKLMTVLLDVIENDNEKCALIAYQIFLEVIRKYPGRHYEDAKKTLNIFHKATSDFLKNVPKILGSPRPNSELDELDIKKLVDEVFISTQFVIQGNKAEFIPRGMHSLKFLSEIPTGSLLMNNLYKENTENIVWEIVEMAAEIISTHPTEEQRSNPHFYQECYVQFFQIQTKFTAFVLHMYKKPEDQNRMDSFFKPDKIPQIFLNLLINCPSHVPQTRREIIQTMRNFIFHCFDHRKYLASQIELFIDDKVLLGSGWTSHEALLSTTYTQFYDVIHHLRDQLSMKQIVHILNHFSKNLVLHEPTLNASYHMQTIRLLMGLVDVYAKNVERELQRQNKSDYDSRILFLKIFAIITFKIENFVKYAIPAIVSRESSPSRCVQITTLETLNASFHQSISESASCSSDNNELNEQMYSSNLRQPNDGPLRFEELNIKFGFPHYSVPTPAEGRILCKGLMNALKNLAIRIKEVSERTEFNQNQQMFQSSLIQQQQAAQLSGSPSAQNTFSAIFKNSVFRPKDLNLLIRLFKSGLKLLGVFHLHDQPQNTRFAASTASSQKKDEQFGKDKANLAARGRSPPEKNFNVLNQTSYQRSKEEKDAIDSFSSIFASLPPQTFRAVLSESMEHFVNCINENISIQLVANHFFSLRATSYIFSNLLVEFLISRMEVMGENPELSNLYLRLFKVVFGSVQYHPNDNELMLKPHVSKIVNNSMNMALKAKEPYNYFQLLRALFRSIGGGSHDLLYHEFLPLLPTLLKGLNQLQSGIHIQSMKDLFVELCLTIPVRLSSLLPYLPWLMEPLVSALNGTQSLIAQGLRTLELCVDNLQPDFLYEHIQPIRTELMQALWKTLSHPVDSIASVSFRILGKLGGSNHKLMIEPQKLTWIDHGDSTAQYFTSSTDSASQSAGAIKPDHIPPHNASSYVSISFSEVMANPPPQHSSTNSTTINLPIDKIIETAYKVLRDPASDNFYVSQSWEIIKGFLASHVQTITSEEDALTFQQLFITSSLTAGDLPPHSTGFSSFSNGTFLDQSSLYMFPDEKQRKIHELALISMVIASSIKGFQHTNIVRFMVPLVRHYTMLAICQQAAGPRSGLTYTTATLRGNGSTSVPKFSGMDPLVLVDALAAVMGQEANELCKAGCMMFRIIWETTISFLGSKERASQLPLYEYILDRVCALCYERPWYSKYGGCYALKHFLLKHMSVRWIFNHAFKVLKAMLFVIMDLSGGLSSGVIELAKDNLNVLIKTCASPIDSTIEQRELADAQKKALSYVIQEMLRSITSPHTLVREEAMHLLQVLAQTAGKTVTEIATPHKGILEEMICTRKHKLIQLPPNIQIGILDCNTFCTTLEPPLFAIDTNNPDHMNFFNEVHGIAETTDLQLQKQSCYKGLESLVPLKKSCLKVLAAWHHIPAFRPKIFSALYMALDSTDIDLQECAFQCFDKYKDLKDVDPDLIRSGIRNLIKNISDFRTLTPSSIICLRYFARLFTYIFNDKFCEQFLKHLYQLTEVVCQNIRKGKDRDFKVKLQAVTQNNGVLTSQQAYELNSKLNQLDVNFQHSVCIEIINLFAEMTTADSTYVEHLMKFLIKSENMLDNYAAFKFYEPMRRFLLRYPQATVTFALKHLLEHGVFRILKYLITGENGAPFRAALYQHSSKTIIALLRIHASSLGTVKTEDSSSADVPSPTGSTSSSGSVAATAKTIERFHLLSIIKVLLKYDENWLSSQPELFHILRSIWLSDTFFKEHTTSLSTFEYSQFKEPKVLAKCLLAHFNANKDSEIDTLFILLRAFIMKHNSDTEFFRKYLSETIMKTQSAEWKRAAFLRFVEIFREEIDHGTSLWTQELITNILKFVIIPAFAYSFECGETERLLGPPSMKAQMLLQDKQENPDLVYIFVSKIYAEIKHYSSDSVRIALMQFMYLIIDRATAYVQPNNSKRQEKQTQKNTEDNSMRLIMSYPWSTLSEHCIDPGNKYFGHLLMALLITRMPLAKSITRSMYLSLMKPTSSEAKQLVRASLDLLINHIAQNQKHEHFKKMLPKWFRQTFIEESCNQQHLMHLMQVISRHHRQFYENRHQFIPSMMNTINRMVLTNNVPAEMRRIALDLLEVIIRWEVYRKQEASEHAVIENTPGSRVGQVFLTPISHKRSYDKMENDSPMGAASELGGTPKKELLSKVASGPILKEQAEMIMNILIRFPIILCESNSAIITSNTNAIYASQTSSVPIFSPDYLIKRAQELIKIVFQTDIWPNLDIRNSSIEKALSSKEINSINAALDLLSIFLQTMKKEMMLKVFIGLQKSIYTVCQNTHPHVSRPIYNLLCKLMSIFPPSCSNMTISPKSGATVKIYHDQLEPLEQLYTDIHSLILTGFNAYDKAIIPQTQSYIGTETTSTLSSLSATLNILKAACFNQPSYIDRLLTPFLHMFTKLVKEHQHFSNVPRVQANQAEQFASSKSAELIVTSLELVKNRVGAFNSEMRRSFMNNIFQSLIEKTTDAKVMKTLVKIFEDWLKNQPSSQGRASGAHPGMAFRDKASFLTKIASGIEQRRELSEDAELKAIFLDLIYYIYSESSHKAPDLATKIEASFMKGLCSPQPLIRQKFFGLLNTHIRKRLYDRIMYIVCEQNWETIGNHYWIGQCIELLLSVSDCDASLKSPNVFAKLPLPTSFVATVTGQFGDKYSCPIPGSFSALGMDSLSATNEDVVDYDFIGTPSALVQDRSTGPADVDMTEFSVDNSEADVRNDSSLLMDSQSDHSAAANSFYNDLFGIQTSSSAAHLRALNRDRSGSIGFNSYGLTSVTAGTQPVENKVQQLTQVCSFLRHLDQLKSSTFINAVAHLCHFDASLAHHIWIQLFPRAYAVLHEKMQLTIALQMAPFFISGAHVLAQLSRDPPKSPLHTFYEATTFCRPTINLRPSIMKYIGKNHNVWHRVVLTLEETLEKFDTKIQSVGVGGLLANGSNAYNGQLAAPKSTRGSNSNAAQDGNMSASTPNHLEIFPELPSNGITYSQECAIALNQVYELLREEDYWAGVWQQEAKFDQTKIAIALEQMGFFEEAKSTYELAMSKAKDDYLWTNPTHHLLKDEYLLWEQHWIRCSKELNQWDFLLDYANATDCKNNHLIMESAWRIPDWDQMYDAIMAVEQNTPKVHAWKVPFYKGYNYICSSKHRELDQVQKCVDNASRILIQEWRRLPHIVSAVHVDYLHAAHQVMELNEAGQLHLAVFNGNVPPPSGSVGSSGHERTAPVDLRSVIKTWKNRLPVVSDDLSRWSDIFTWRQHHYQTLLQRYEGEMSRPGNSTASQNSLVGSHASAQSLIHYAKIARKHSLTSVCLDSLNRIHTIPRVPIIDCFQKIRQQLKCYLFMHQMKPNSDDLQEGLKVIESTHLRFFQREMISEFYALRGQFLAKTGQFDEANKTFSVAVQILDTIVPPWAAWGDYYDTRFSESETPYEKRNLTFCAAAIVSYLHACRFQNEIKARKYLSKVIWFISYDDETHSLARVVDKYSNGVPVFNWLPWVSQVLTCLSRSEGDYMGNLAQSISKIYPQAMYYPARAIFLSYRMEVREIKNKRSTVLNNEHHQIFDDAIKATANVMRFSKLLHNQRDTTPTVTTTLENIAEQLTLLRENWYEAVYRNLQLCLAKCYTSAFESTKNSQQIEPPIPPHLLSFLRKLIFNMCNNNEALASQNKVPYGDDGAATTKGNVNSNDNASRRIQLKDPLLSKFKIKFSSDFDFSQSNKKLQFLISRIKKWIKLLEKQMSMSTKTYLLEEKSRYLAQFNRKMIAVALPGDFLIPKLDSNSIDRFMPFVETISKHNCFTRRLTIRGENGKIYPYLVINEYSTLDHRREERFFQLQRLFNLYLLKHKESARRLLNFTVPKVVTYSNSSRLIEDNTTSLSLQDIYKKYAIQKGSELDAPIAKYYEELTKQKKGTHPLVNADLRQILADIQASLVPKTVLKEWAVKTFSSAPDFWHFRKQFILQLGLINFSEFVFILNPINPDMIHIHRNSGLITPTFPRFDIYDDSGELLNNIHRVPFRITLNLQDFITKIGIQGPLTATITSAAICFSHPNYKVRNLLLAILRDEFINWSKRVKSSELNNRLNALIIQSKNTKQSPDFADKHNSSVAIKPSIQLNSDLQALVAKEIKEITNEEVVNLTKKAAAVMLSRLSSFSNIDIHNAADSKVTQLISLATTSDKLARMDPAWHPWL